MKAVKEMPATVEFIRAMFPPRHSAPAPVPVTSSPMRPVDIRRFVRDQRESRRYTFTRDFLY